MTDWGTQFIGMCSKKCKVAWGKYANKHATVAQVKSYASQKDTKFPSSPTRSTHKYFFSEIRFKIKAYILIFKAVDNMGQLVYDYGPHNVNPDIFSEEKEKNEKLYFLAYPTDKENDFTTSIEKFKERLTAKYKKICYG